MIFRRTKLYVFSFETFISVSHRTLSKLWTDWKKFSFHSLLLASNSDLFNFFGFGSSPLTDASLRLELFEDGWAVFGALTFILELPEGSQTPAIPWTAASPETYYELVNKFGNKMKNWKFFTLGRSDEIQAKFLEFAQLSLFSNTCMLRFIMNFVQLSSILSVKLAELWMQLNENIIP